MAHPHILEYKSGILHQLKKIFPIENFSENDLQKLLRICEIRKFRTGQVIIEQGNTDDFTYYLVSGQVRIEKDGNPLFVLRRTGDVFGEMGVIDGFQRSASVMALEDCVCIAINMKRLENVVEAENYAFKYMLYRNLSRELSAKLRATTKALLEARGEITRLKREYEK